MFGFRFIEQQFFPDSSRPELMVDTVAAGRDRLRRQRGAGEEVRGVHAASSGGVESVTTYVGTGSPRFYLPLDQIFPQTNVSQLIVLPKDLKTREVPAAEDRRRCSRPISRRCAAA